MRCHVKMKTCAFSEAVCQSCVVFYRMNSLRSRWKWDDLSPKCGLFKQGPTVTGHIFSSIDVMHCKPLKVDKKYPVFEERPANAHRNITLFVNSLKSPGLVWL